MWDHVKKIENFWTTLPELEPGIISRIATAAAQRLGVKPVATITEALALLAQLDDIRNQPRLMRSFKKAIGVAID